MAKVKSRSAKARQRKAAKERNKNLILQLRLDSFCLDCGISGRDIAITFDHLRDKLFNISDGKSKTKTQLLDELDKCEPVCRTCHDIRELKRQR